MKQATPLKYYTRNAKFNRYVIQKPMVALMPRETFEGHPDVLAAYDEMVRLNEAVTTNQRDAARKNREADEAALKYRADVGAAMAAGKDPSKVKELEPQLRAEAKQHDAWAKEALAKAERHGLVLGTAIHKVARECFTTSEASLTEAADAVEGAIATLEAAFNQWSTAWAIRAKLSTIAMTGGDQHGFRGATGLPADVTKALDSLRSETGNLNQLKADEAELDRWRAENTKAEASNRRMFEAAEAASV